MFKIQIALWILFFSSSTVFAQTGTVCYARVNNTIYYEQIKIPKVIGSRCHIHNSYGSVVWLGNVGIIQPWVQKTPQWEQPK